MKKVILILIVIFSLPFGQGFGAAAQTNLDSLYTVWQDQSQPDSTRVKAYANYIWDGFIYSNPDSAEVLAEDLYSFSKKNNYPQAAIEGLVIQGDINFGRGNYPLALEYFEQSLKIYEEMGDKKGIANSMYSFGNVYAELGNNSRALEYYELSLKISKELSNKRGIANCQTVIGIIYKQQGNYPLALEYFEKALKFSEEMSDKMGIAIGLINTGVIYKQQSNYPRALECYEQSQKIFEELRDNQGIATSLHNIGGLYKKLGNYPLALEYYEKALKIREDMGDKRGIASSLNNMGRIYKVIGNNSRAIDFCKKGLALAEEIEVLGQQKNACQCLYDTYKAMGKGNEALVYIERVQEIDDSLNAEKTARKLQQMEFVNQVYQDSVATAEKERLIAEAHKEEVRKKNQTRNVLAAVGLILLLLAGGIFGRLRYVRKSKAVLQVEKDRSENLLLNILPAEIAQELKEKGKAEARDFDMVSILFTDFKDFTEASAKLSASDLVAEINTCFEAFDGIMSKYGIEKIKTIGDSYMAAGGLPVPTDDSIKNTALAALEMQTFIISRKAEMDAAGKPAFEMRVGIHTGPVVAGIVGVKKFQYDIWGDTVNTASRMESTGEVGKVNISESTYNLLKSDPDFSFESRGKIEAKGKGELKMYFAST